MKTIGYRVHKAIKEIQILQGGVDSNSGMWVERFTYSIPYSKENIEQLKKLGIKEIQGGLTMGVFKLFHGTTFEGGQDIPRNGYDYDKGNSPWSCSDDARVYFYFPQTVLNRELGVDDEDATEDEWKEAEQKCLELANESAQIAQALLPNPQNRTCVLEFIFPDTPEFMHNVYDYIAEDWSCENMNLANSIDVSIINKMIKERKCEIVVHYFPFFPKLSLFYLGSLVDNPYFQEAFEKMNKIDQVSLSLVGKIDYWQIFEDLTYVEEKEGEQMIYNFKALNIDE